MRVALHRHPDSAGRAVDAIEVEVGRPASGRLALRYTVIGAIGDLLLPAVGPPARADGLWRHTCFEAFLRPSAGEAYREFNFAPSTSWAAYVFDGYRSGMRNADIEAPIIEALLLEKYQLNVLVAIPGEGPWRLGLSAVIEEPSGAKSWWALAHPPGPPDFHHEDCFALRLPAATSR